MRYCIAKAREMEKNNSNKTTKQTFLKIKRVAFKNGGVKKCRPFVSTHPIPIIIPSQPAHKINFQTLPFLPIYIPPKNSRGASQ